MGATFWALLCAFFGGLGVVLQQKGAMEAPPAGSAGFVSGILRSPVWLGGAACQFVCWVFQGVALSRGPLSLVQPIASLQIVIALPLGIAITSQHVTRRAWIGAVFVVVGVGLFLAATHPGDGRSTAPGGVWLAATGLLAALIALAAIIGARRRPAARAAFFGAAAGLSFGYQAAVMKTFVDVVPGGLGAILSSWTTYALIASALGGFYFLQSALQIGVLAPAIASSNATSPITSVALGRVIFLETTQRSNGGRIVSAVSAGLLLAGVIVLAREPRP